jgi:hypothetical protein
LNLLKEENIVLQICWEYCLAIVFQKDDCWYVGMLGFVRCAISGTEAVCDCWHLGGVRLLGFKRRAIVGIYTVCNCCGLCGVRLL